jgi:hypothetical protein
MAIRSFPTIPHMLLIGAALLVVASMASAWPRHQAAVSYPLQQPCPTEPPAVYYCPPTWQPGPAIYCQAVWHAWPGSIACPPSEVVPAPIVPDSKSRELLPRPQVPERLGPPAPERDKTSR